MLVSPLLDRLGSSQRWELDCKICLNAFEYIRCNSCDHTIGSEGSSGNWSKSSNAMTVPEQISSFQWKTLAIAILHQSHHRHSHSHDLHLHDYHQTSVSLTASPLCLSSPEVSLWRGRRNSLSRHLRNSKKRIYTSSSRCCPDVCGCLAKNSTR